MAYLGLRHKCIQAVFLSAALLLLTACGSTRGIVEFQRYIEAFNLQSEAGNAVLDSVARAERTVAVRRIKRRGLVPDFRPDEAAYWVDSVQPPITASIRSSIKVLQAYNGALGGLGSGETAEALAGRLGKLINETTSAAVNLGVAFQGPTVVPGSDKLISELAKRVDIFTEIFKAVAIRSGREQFRKQLIDAAPTMQEFLVELRTSTPVMFELMKRGRVTRGNLENSEGISSSDLKELERERAILAGWVLLMDQTLISMNSAIVAVETKNTPFQSALEISEAVIELRIVAEQVRGIRSKP